MGRSTLGFLALLLSASVGYPVTFVRRPTASETDAGVRIEFIVDGITDVTVALVDEKGAVVRHLTAGKLGEKAPPPLIKDAYGQSILWDRTDDAGRVVPAGRYTVRVGLGLKPAFSRMIGGGRETTGRVLGLAVHPKRGDLFVLSALGSGADRTAVIQVRDRNGAYLRTILPYPSSLRALHTGGLRSRRGGWVPRVFDGDVHALMSGLGAPLRQVMAMTARGQLFFDGGGAPRQVLRLDPNGAWPEGKAGGPLLPTGAGAGHLHLALSHNETYLYVSGLRRGTGSPEPLHVVCRAQPRSGRPAEVWLGELGKPGRDERHFNDPRGVATDRVGNVYVADHGNDRIGVFDTRGRWLGALRCDDPDQIIVHPETGAIYVLAIDHTEREMLKRWNEPVAYRKKRLLKLAGWDPRKGPRPGPDANRVVASLGLRATEGFPILALDPSADPPILWYSEDLSRIEDRGDKLAITRKRIREDPGILRACAGLVADRTRDEIYVDTASETGYRWARYDGKTGRYAAYRLRSRETGRLAVGPDGVIHLRSAGRVSRFDHDGRPAARDSSRAYRFSLAGEQRQADIRGFTVAPGGNVYILRRTSAEAGSPLQVDVYSAAGDLEREGLVTGLTPGASCVRVDAAGNVYVSEAVRAGHELIPLALAGRVAVEPRTAAGKPNWYPLLYGSVVKFGPKGGAVQTAGTGYAAYAAVSAEGTRTYRINNAQWVRAGCSPILVADRQRYWCSSSFDVDAFGRSFVPSALTAEVVVLDPAGSEIARLGTYGNVDAAGSVAAPVPLAWPAHVAVSDAACYVGDPLNHRVVRLELKYALEASVAVTVK